MSDHSTNSSWELPKGVETLRVETTAYYALQLPEAPVTARTPVLIALHGWGQRAQSFLRRFSGLRDQDMVVVAPQGPHQTYLDFETRKVGFSWLTAYDRARAIPDLVILIDRVLDEVQREVGAGGPRYVLGFSQGVSVAYRYALRTAHPVRGVVACGGDLPPDVAAAMDSAEQFPVLLVHGNDDAIVPPEKCDDAEKALAARQWPHEVHRFHGGHDIPADEARFIADWVQRREA